MSEVNHPARGDRVPLSQKVAYGFGMLGNQLFAAVMTVFMVILVMALNMDPLLAGILTAAPRIFDAVTDPIMGYVTDNARTRWGRRRPFILLGAVIAGFAYMAMWQLYPEDSVMYNFYYFLFMSLVYYLGYTIFATPLVAFGYEMSTDYHERTSIMAISQWIGQLAWVIAPWAWVIVYMDSLFETPAVGCRQLAIWVGFLCMLFAIIPAVFCKERELPEDKQAAKLTLGQARENFVEFIASIGQTLKCGPFVLLCLSTLLIFNAYMIITQFQYFIFVHHVFSGDTAAVGHYPAWYGTLASLATILLVIPCVSLLSKKIGKKLAFIVAMSISVVGYLMKWWFFSQETPWLIFFTLPLTSFGIGGLFTLMMSMTSDVCDLDEVNTGYRREGMFAAIYWWFVKLGQAIAGFISGLILSLVGYNEAPGAIQSVETMTNLRIADALIPAIGTLIGIFVMVQYNVSEKRANEVRAILDARNAKKSGEAKSVRERRAGDRRNGGIDARDEKIERRKNSDDRRQRNEGWSGDGVFA